MPLVLGLLGFLLLAGIAAWQWTVLQDVRHQLASQNTTPVDPGRLEAIEGQLRDVAHDVQTLQAKPQQPAPPPVDLAPLEDRLAALEKRPSPPSVDLAPLDARLAVLEQRPPPPRVDLAPLDAQLAALGAQLAALEKRPTPPPVDLTPLQTRLAALENRPPPDDSALRSQLQALSGQVDELTRRLDAARTQAVQSDQRASQAQHLETAMLALTSGRPLGEVSGAPPALSRFATAAPPTEASLRLSFEAAAKAAEAASDPAAGTTDLGSRVWQRVQTLVTVRRGDRVLVGAPAASVLADARQHLVAGDLAGAVASLDRLDPGAAHAMADWRAQAQSLLDARSALASLAAAPTSTGTP